MQLSHDKIRSLFFDDWLDTQHHLHDVCGDYGEPGYSIDVPDATTPMVWLGDWWCHCDKPFPGRRADDDLHGVTKHWPRLFDQLESQGVELVWYDEWTVDCENDKAYRTSGDCYGWQPVTIYSEGGDLITPDDDIETWIEAVSNGRGLLPSRVWSSGDLKEAGFELWADRLEAGWHPGMDADPIEITAAIRAVYGDSVDIVFQTEENSQFYSVFAAYIRPVESEDEDG